MALQEAAVYRPDIILQHARRRRQARFMTAGRQSVFNFPQKDVRDTWSFDASATPECLGWRKKIKRFYLQTREGVLTTPKIGAKSRAC